MGRMKTLIKVLSIATFVLATATVLSVFYEATVLRWLDHVSILIPATDILFLLSTVAGFFYYKRRKLILYCHLFSSVVIAVGIVVVVIYGHNIPGFLFTLWEFYILYFYGFVVIRRWWDLKE